jgi:hypothetical protein
MDRLVHQDDRSGANEYEKKVNNQEWIQKCSPKIQTHSCPATKVISSTRLFAKFIFSIRLSFLSLLFPFRFLSHFLLHFLFAFVFPFPFPVPFHFAASRALTSVSSRRRSSDTDLRLSNSPPKLIEFTQQMR